MKRRFFTRLVGLGTAAIPAAAQARESARGTVDAQEFLPSVDLAVELEHRFERWHKYAMSLVDVPGWKINIGTSPLAGLSTQTLQAEIEHRRSHRMEE